MEHHTPQGDIQQRTGTVSGFCVNCGSTYKDPQEVFCPPCDAFYCSGQWREEGSDKKDNTQQIGSLNPENTGSVRTFEGEVIDRANIVSFKDMGFGHRITLRDGSIHYTYDKV